MSVASSHHATRGEGRALLFLIATLTAAPLCAQILDWESAIGETAPSNSVFTEVEAFAGASTGGVDAAFACGHFEGNFNLPGLLPLPNSAGQDGVVARFNRAPSPPFNWNADWLAQASSLSGSVTINDLVFDEVTGNYYITGTYINDVSFSGSPVTLTTAVAGDTEGFVAWGELGSGDFINAFAVQGMEPKAIALDDTTAIFLAGPPPGAFARRYPPGGGAAFTWSIPAPAGTTEVVGLAVTPDPTGQEAYVLSGNNTTALEVTVVQLDGGTGTPAWTARMGGNGIDSGGGIGVGTHGDPRVTFSSQAATIQYQSPSTILTLPDVPPLPATHGIVLRLDPTGELLWSAVLGEALTPSDSMKTTGLSIDRAGNTYVCAAFQGAFVIEAQTFSGNQDVALLGVDATGLLFDFHQSSGAGQEGPTSLAAPTRELLVTVGRYEGSPSNFGAHTLPVPDPGESHAFLSALGPRPIQGRFIVTPDPLNALAPTVDELVDELHILGGQVYGVIRFSGTGLGVAAFLTNDQAASIRADPRLLIESDFPLRPSGSSLDAGWALHHLNDATSPATAPYPYSYADTDQAVNVYLLDTAVDNSSGWFDTNTNLTIESTTLVRGAGDPLVSSDFQHGTEMMSLVGGPHVGAALGTPITFKTFDFYPNGVPSTASLLADAIYQAIDYHLDFSECKPGLIIISSSGASFGSATVTSAVSEAIAEGIAVVVSAGNSGADAAGFIPASSGTTSGVICVAASKQDRSLVGNSNHTTIDCAAPGEAVRVIDYGDPHNGHATFTGTSASAALTGAVAAAYLSANPWATPAQLESALIGDAYPDLGSGLDIAQLASGGASYFLTYDDWATWHGLSDDTHAGDDDGDGWTNLEEYFHGFKPSLSDPWAPQTWISHNSLSNKYTYSFLISSVLLDSSTLGTLLDGGTYEVTSSPTLTGFTTAPGTLKVGSSTGRQTEINLENTVVDSKCFLRLEISPASPSP